MHEQAAASLTSLQAQHNELQLEAVELRCGQLYVNYRDEPFAAGAQTISSDISQWIMREVSSFLLWINIRFLGPMVCRYCWAYAISVEWQ